MGIFADYLTATSSLPSRGVLVLMHELGEQTYPPGTEGNPALAILSITRSRNHALDQETLRELAADASTVEGDAALETTILESLARGGAGPVLPSSGSE